MESGRPPPRSAPRHRLPRGRGGGGGGGGMLGAGPARGRPSPPLQKRQAGTGGTNVAAFSRDRGSPRRPPPPPPRHRARWAPAPAPLCLLAAQAGPGSAPRGRGRVGEPGSARSSEQQRGSHGDWGGTGVGEAHWGAPGQQGCPPLPAGTGGVGEGARGGPGNLPGAAGTQADAGAQVSAWAPGVRRSQVPPASTGGAHV